MNTSIFRTIPILIAITLATQYNGGTGHHTYILACLLILAVFTYNIITNRQPFTWPNYSSPLIWFTAYVLWVTLSLFWSSSVGPTALSQPRLYAGLLMALTAYIVLTRDFRLSLVGLQLLALVLSLYTIYQGLFLGIERPSAFFVNWNTHAAFLNLILFPAAAWHLTGKNKILTGMLIAIIAFASAMTLSRGAILGGAVGLMCLALLSRNHISRSAFAGLMLWIIGGYLIGSGLHEGAPFARLASSVAGENITSGRWVIWESGLEMYKQFPLLGWGMETYWQAYPPFRHPYDGSSGQNVHNEYLQFLIELGPIGLILFIGLLCTLAYRVYKSRESIGLEGAGLSAALLALAVQASFTTTYYQLAIWLIFGWYVGRLSFLTAGETRHTWSPAHWFTRKGFITVTLLTAAIPGTWLMAMFMSEVELKKLENTQSAGEFLRQLPKVEKYYNLRDVTHLLFAAQIRSALIEKEDGVTLSQKYQAIETALARLEQAELLYPMRADNFLYRAQLKQLAPEKYTIAEIIAAYQKALERDPYSLPARLSFARYLEGIDMNNRRLHVLEEGWNRHYFGSYQAIETYIDMLKKAKISAGITNGMEAIAEVEARINSRRAEGYLVDHIFVGRLPKRN
jgi:O-antigen ligase